GAWALCYPRPPCRRDPALLAGAGVEHFCSVATGARLPGGLGVLGKGHAGVVLAASTRWGPAAVKVLRLDSKRGSLAGEAALQAVAARAGAAPEVYAWGGWFIVSRLVPGPSLGDLGRPPPAWAVLEALRAARALDAVGILHHEIHRPWRNVLYTPAKALIVDYESASRGCGNVPKLLSGIAARSPALRRALPGLRGLLRLYREAGCPRGLYREIEERVAQALALGDAYP
ncbi:MAG: hypothetical protein GSR80_000904, partial [Desulfurococcales archaeon]|nr:hypothetical protein [Desulfurococcales archaeon]